MKINMSKPNIWITYAWKDNNKGDFDYIVQELHAIGIESRYDKIELIPGRLLWDQIGNNIINGPFSAWCYLITSESLKSRSCKEELAYALYRAMNDKDDDYPLIGLVHGVSISDIPPALKVRLCVNLDDPNWKDQIKAGIEGRPPQSETTSQTQFIYQAYENDTTITIEIKPRFGEVMYWRFAIPKNVKVIKWGYGPAGGGSISGLKTNSLEGLQENVNGVPTTCFGAGDRLSPGISAYVVLDKIPDFIGFGLASEPFGPPTQLEIYNLKNEDFV